ncbi:MAG: glycosyltransferase family 4 protein [Planctomycetes bacterium]|nr:glycosyltransferase family 4 protein [Planctomycetota bacterium]
MSGLKLLFLSTRAERPSYRYRVDQMLPHFQRAGHQCDVRFFPRNIFSRLLLYRELSSYDVVFIQKRLIAPMELALLRRWSKKLVFDVDDAIMFDGDGNPDGHRLRRFGAMMHSADLVVCGNAYLANQAARFGGRTLIIPTAIDTNRFQPVPHELSQADGDTPVVIGWTGSRSTTRYLNTVFPVLSRIRGNVELKIISDATDDLQFEALGAISHRFVPWSAETEVAETAEFDIGLMPLPDDNMTQGKCGCKALQYMALGIPAVCSPVGVNCDIIQHGRNGFLPKSPAEWQTVLQCLVDDRVLRTLVGRSGRHTAEARYSLASIASQLVSAIERAA